MKEINTEHERALATTACIRNSGFSAKSMVCAFNISQYQTESELLLNPLLLIHAKHAKEERKARKGKAKSINQKFKIERK